MAPSALASCLERVTRIELALSAWEAISHFPVPAAYVQVRRKIGGHVRSRLAAACPNFALSGRETLLVLLGPDRQRNHGGRVEDVRVP